MIRVGGMALIAVVLGIQFVPLERTNPPVRTTIDPPDEVDRILRQACWDCHSNETEWPWYAHVAPVSWLVTGDVQEARGEMNLTDWPADDLEEVQDLVEEIGEEIEEDEMPLKRYRWLHSEGRLSPEERQVLIDWSQSGGGADGRDEAAGGQDETG